MQYPLNMRMTAYSAKPKALMFLENHICLWLSLSLFLKQFLQARQTFRVCLFLFSARGPLSVQQLAYSCISERSESHQFCMKRDTSMLVIMWCCSILLVRKTEKGGGGEEFTWDSLPCLSCKLSWVTELQENVLQLLEEKHLICQVEIQEL